MKRFGTVIRVKPGKLEEYKRLHAAAWPGVIKMIRECSIRNYTIFHRDGYLFSYFEYHGTDWDADMKKMAADPVSQEWLKRTGPCQEPLPSMPKGGSWAEMEEVFHLE